MLLLLVACLAPPAPDRVVLVTWDTVSAEHLALYGGAARTPTLDALAAHGAVYQQAITPMPETVWAHWSMFTGALPALHGPVPRHLDSAWTGPTVAEQLRAKGYATGAFIGGVTLEAGLTGLNRGFDLYDDRGTPGREPKRDGGEVVAAALEWTAQQTGPWFAFVHLFDAHYPYDTVPASSCDPGYSGVIDGSMGALGPYQGFSPPAPALSEPDLAHVARLYACEIERIDAITGQLVAGLPQGTRIIVVADHGESFSQGYFFNHRRALHDEVLRVPLVVSRAGSQEPPSRVADQVSLTAVQSLILGEPAPVSPVVMTLLDPWDQPGRLSARRVAEDGRIEQAIWALRAGDAVTVSEPPLAVRRGDEALAEVPEALARARSDYSDHIAAQSPGLRALPDRAPHDAQLVHDLRELGYLDGGGPAEPPSEAPPAELPSP